MNILIGTIYAASGYVGNGKWPASKHHSKLDPWIPSAVNRSQAGTSKRRIGAGKVS